MSPYRDMQIRGDIKLSWSDRLIISGSPGDKILLFFISLAKILAGFLAAVTLLSVVGTIFVGLVYGMYLLTCISILFLLLPLFVGFLIYLGVQGMESAEEDLNRKLAPKISDLDK